MFLKEIQSLMISFLFSKCRPRENEWFPTSSPPPRFAQKTQYNLKLLER